jgi:dTDP-4-amino-4,6-dideoxygalactose transaminase
MLVSERIYLSPPHMSGMELQLIQQAFDANWIAPVGPQLVEFEQKICDYVGVNHAVALSSGTAAIHLALLIRGVQQGDDVIVSTLTFSGSVNPIMYVGANPVFVDSEPHSWNMDPNLLEDTLRERVKTGKLPKAVIPVHLYGQSADMDAIMQVCDRYGVDVIEDAAEALGTSYKGKHAGSIGLMGILSFNGNKMITTSGGGMLISDHQEFIDRARKLSTQAREPFPYYEHTEVGYNYRMSNICAAIGSGQMSVIEERVARRREIYETYRQNLSDLDGLTFVEDMPYGRHTHWLTVVLVDEEAFGASPEQIRLELEKHNIETRPLWKPMHLQPVFAGYEAVGGGVAESLFARGLCLPSGTALTSEQQDRIMSLIRGLHR